MMVLLMSNILFGLWVTILTTRNTIACKYKSLRCNKSRNNVAIKITSFEVIFSCEEPSVDPGFRLLFQNQDWLPLHPFRAQGVW